MIKYFKGTKIQISPCIAAKAKFVLNLSHKKPINTKKCSLSYWNKVIDTFSCHVNLSTIEIKEAKNQFKNLIK